MWKFLFIFFHIKERTTDGLIPSSLPRLVLSYKGSLELLVRETVNQSARDSLLKARPDRDRLPANISGCLGQVWP